MGVPHRARAGWIRRGRAQVAGSGSTRLGGDPSWRHEADPAAAVRAALALASGGGPGEHRPWQRWLRAAGLRRPARSTLDGLGGPRWAQRAQLFFFIFLYN